MFRHDKTPLRTGGLALALLACAGTLPGRPNAAHGQGIEGPAPRVEFEPAELRLGQTYLGEVGQGSFQIWNRGDAPLIISDIQKSCGCAVVRLSKDQKTIAPGKFTEVQVSLKPSGTKQESVFKKPLVVLCNDPQQPRANYWVSTTLILPVAAEPSAVLVEDVKPTVPRTEKIVLTSYGDEPFAIEEVRLPDGPIRARFEKGIEAKVHEVELVIGPGLRVELKGTCTIVTTHPRMKDVKVRLNLKAMRLLTAKPRMFLLGHVAAGSTVTRSIKLMPAPGYTVDRVDLEVARYPTIEVEATRVPGDDHLWDLAFRIPLETAGEIIATTMTLKTNIEEAEAISITLNARVDRGVELGPDTPALP
ncbi:MAG: DUF1573 domain-containing protein [Phycisphaerales bacterium]|nr:MAG: DUF1573 domain-containing protein [Phycisphaerales bacterium]